MTSLGRFSKAIAAGIPSAILVLNQILPVTSGTTKLEVNAALAVLTVLAVYFAPKNADPAPAAAKPAVPGAPAKG